MTELEKIAYAKGFIDKLAAGVDPTDGSLIPEGEVALNPRISKCFLYVSGILENIINNPSDAYKVSEWSASADVVSKIECSSFPVSISTFAKRINTALGATRKFTAYEINNWFLRECYMMHVMIGGGMANRPTEKGTAIGITADEYLGDGGRLRCRIRLDINAQCFVRNHLADIIELAKSGYHLDSTDRSVPFTLTKGELEGFPYSEVPLTVSQITEILNELGGENNTAKLKATDITGWLLNIGMLRMVGEYDKKYKLPTETGASIGIGVEHRRARETEYSVAVYNVHAQKFIVDNIHAIIRVI